MNGEKLDYFRDKERLRLAAYETGPANAPIYYQNNRRSTAVLMSRMRRKRFRH